METIGSSSKVRIASQPLSSSNYCRQGIFDQKNPLKVIFLFLESFLQKTINLLLGIELPVKNNLFFRRIFPTFGHS
jgi:hypothetical protein